MEPDATLTATQTMPPETRAGAVLSKRNREDLENAESLIRKVIDSAKKPDGDEGETEENAAAFGAEFRSATPARRLPKGVETRVACEMRLVEEEGKPSKIVGYAVKWDVVTELPWFKEIVRKGAFTKTIADKSKARDDIKCLLNHNYDLLLGRTNNGSLVLTEDDIGLRYEATLPDTQTAKDAHTLIKGSFIDQSSYAFRPTKKGQKTTTIGEWPDEDITREIFEAILFDVSPCVYPAQSETEVEALRSAFESAGLDLSTLMPQLLRRQAGLPINPDALRSSLLALRSLLPEGSKCGCGRCKSEPAQPDTVPPDNPPTVEAEARQPDPTPPADAVPPETSKAAEPVTDHSEGEDRSDGLEPVSILRRRLDLKAKVARKA